MISVPICFKNKITSFPAQFLTLAQNDDFFARNDHFLLHSTANIALSNISMMKKQSLIYVALFGLIALSGCKIADIRPASLKNITYSEEQEKKGRKILKRVVETAGFSKLSEHKVYEYTGRDDWPGFLGKQTTLWPDNKKLMRFQFSFNTFDGSVEFLEGESAGLKAGLQSWQYYEEENDSVSFKNEPNKKYAFGLTAFHYFTELPYRLLHAPLVQYVGKKTYQKKEYELVFVTWETLDPHPDFDQYLLWINPETSLIDYCVYTLRDNKNPIIRKFYGSIAYLDYRDVDGVILPYQYRVFTNDNVFKEGDYFHELVIEEYLLGSFDEEELYPNKEIDRVGDAKAGR